MRILTESELQTKRLTLRVLESNRAALVDHAEVYRPGYQGSLLASIRRIDLAMSDCRMAITGVPF